MERAFKRKRSTEVWQYRQGWRIWALCVMEKNFVLRNGDVPENSKTTSLCRVGLPHRCPTEEGRGKPGDLDGHKYVLKASSLT